MNQIFYLTVIFSLVVACTHLEKAPTLTTCRVYANDDYLDFKHCFDGKNSDGTLHVIPKNLAQIDFKKQATGQGRVTYTDFSRSQSSHPVHSNIVKGYILPNGKAHDVVFFDNGADYFEEGLARFVSSEGKTGFINESLQIAISASHDFVAPFRNGNAIYCDGCQIEKSGEHPEIQGGMWGMMDKKGRSIKGPMEKNLFFKSLEIK